MQYSIFSIISRFKRKNSFILKAEGNSMLPILHPNDVVQYRKINFKQIRINDIILVRKNKRLFTHRIIYKTDKYLVTKGNNNLESDGKIYPLQVSSCSNSH
ncbi:S24/S26 family peptidase [Candidatus Roizmanbacteria bacterium]|nr:S24/S26 family peptidase [Candidatus Roizmanbacteria bacterium]